jgi:hypothetical protein
MKKPHIPRIRELMKKAPEGLTVNQLHKLIPDVHRPNTVRKCLERMPDVYIDRWIKNNGNRGQYEAVWCIVVPPEHCPHPDDRFKREIKTQWIGAQA